MFKTGSVSGTLLKSGALAGGMQSGMSLQVGGLVGWLGDDDAASTSSLYFPSLNSHSAVLRSFFFSWLGRLVQLVRRPPRLVLFFFFFCPVLGV